MSDVRLAVTLLQDNSGIQLDKGAQDQLGKGLNQTVTRTRVEVTFGKSVQLPCQCTGENSRGEDVLLTGPEVDIVPRDQRRYVLYSDMTWLKIKDDCSLVMRKVTWEEQGEYTCTYLEPEFKFIPCQLDRRSNNS